MSPKLTISALGGFHSCWPAPFECDAIGKNVSVTAPLSRGHDVWAFDRRGGRWFRLLAAVLLGVIKLRIDIKKAK